MYSKYKYKSQHMESTISERIYQLMEALGLSLSNFSDEVGIDKSSLSHIKTGRSKPTLEMMLKIISRYPDISLDWLILGGGTMRKETSNSQGVDLFTQGNINIGVSETNITRTPLFDVQKKSTNEKNGENSGTNNTKTPQDTPNNYNRQLTKIILLYSDNSYEEILK